MNVKQLFLFSGTHPQPAIGSEACRRINLPGTLPEIYRLVKKNEVWNELRSLIKLETP